MGVMIGCGVLLALGLAGAWRWRNVPFAVPDLHADLTAGEISRRYLWYVSIIITGGVAAGVAVIGAGGRLAMRLLAVTGGEAGPGRPTAVSYTHLRAPGTVLELVCRLLL